MYRKIKGYDQVKIDKTNLNLAMKRANIFSEKNYFAPLKRYRNKYEFYSIKKSTSDLLKDSMPVNQFKEA